MNSASALYRLLGDGARLRLLRVLSRERLNVTELTRILALAQSGVSRHLGLLKDAGLVVEERAGGFTYYRAAPEGQLKPAPTTGSVGAGASVAGSASRRTRARQTDADAEGARLWALLEAQFAVAAGDREGRADEARLQEVLRLRKESFETHGGERGQLVPGRSWAAWARALGHLLPPWRVADLGCGEGYLTIEAARWAKNVVAVDRSEAVLRQARGLARRRGITNITWKRGEIEQVPIRDASVEVALLSQALHHAADPKRALAEAVRIVTPGGRVLVLDLREHDQAWVRDRLGDRWLGFDDRRLRSLLEGAGLVDVKVAVGARRRGDPFTVIVASGVKAGTGDPGLGTRKRSQTKGNSHGAY